MLNNYPISTFDEQYTDVEDGTGHTILHRTPNEQTLGFHLDNLDQPQPHPIDDLPRFAGSVFDALLDIQNILLKTNRGDELRTVFINDLGVKTTDFQLSDQLKWELVARGRVATADFLSRPRPPRLPEVKRLLRRS